MSYDTHRNWLYRLEGRHIKLWQYTETGAVDTLTSDSGLSYKVRLPGSFYGKQLVYPTEDIADGLRIEYTALDEPFVAEALETTTVTHSSLIISFSANTYIRSTTENAFSSFKVNDKIRVQGSGSNDGDYTISAVGSWNPGAGAIANGQITTSESTVSAETAGERVTITQIPAEDTTPDETSHINLNKMLSLAVVDYLKAMVSEQGGQMDLKEYYMKEFYGKLGDNESNKRKISMAFPSGVYAVR